MSDLDDEEFLATRKLNGVDDGLFDNRENNMCKYCNMKIYIAKEKIFKDLIQPATIDGVIVQKCEDISGIIYEEIDNNYCPICGKHKK